jgi:hypothetical protein
VDAATINNMAIFSNSEVEISKQQPKNELAIKNK